MVDSYASNSDSVDFVQLAERARQMRSELEQARDDLGRIEVQGFGGTGLVQATVSGENHLIALAIDSSIIDPDDPETLSYLVREAVNDAMAKLDTKRGERVGSITDGFKDMLSGAAVAPPHVTPLTASRRPPRSDGMS